MSDAPDGAPVPLLKDRVADFAGKRWTFRLSMLGLLALKERWKIEDDTPLVKRLAKRSITDIPALLHACMLRHHPQVLYSEVVTMCDDADMDDLRRAHDVAQEALAAGWGAPGKKPAAGTSPATPPTS